MRTAAVAPNPVAAAYVAAVRLTDGADGHHIQTTIYDMPLFML